MKVTEKTGETLTNRHCAASTRNTRGWERERERVEHHWTSVAEWPIFGNSGRLRKPPAPGWLLGGRGKMPPASASRCDLQHSTHRQLCQLHETPQLLVIQAKAASNASDANYCDRCLHGVVCLSVRPTRQSVSNATAPSKTAERIEVLFGADTSWAQSTLY